MTRAELKGLDNLKIIEENNTTLHIHCKDGYLLYTISEFIDIDKDSNEFTNYEISGSCCYFFPIFDEYPKYKSITKVEYDKLKEEFENLDVAARKAIYDKF